jgi:cytidylate kinase
MIKLLNNIKAWGTETGSDQLIRLDEISLLATPAMIRTLGIFFINAAYEMEENDAEHIHLQDISSNFSQKKHVDIILNNHNIKNK